MTRKEKSLLSKLAKGDFVLTLHARERMSQRFITEEDIVYVAKRAKNIRYQVEPATFLIEGHTEWKENLFISVAYRNEVIIVTVFFEEPI